MQVLRLKDFVLGKDIDIIRNKATKPALLITEGLTIDDLSGWSMIGAILSPNGKDLPTWYGVLSCPFIVHIP